MKYLVILALIAAANAVPQDETVNTGVDQRNQPRFVTDGIASAIEDLQWKIRDAGLDPLHVEDDTVFEFALPVPIIFSLDTFAIELLSTGLSEIVINRINYSIINSRLTFDITMPLIQGNLNGGKAHVVFFAEDYYGEGSGGFSIRNVRLVGDVRVSVGLISGISVRSMTLDFTVGQIKSDIKAQFHGYDFSDLINEFLNITVPDTLTEYRAEINELLEIIATERANEFLNQ